MLLSSHPLGFLCLILACSHVPAWADTLRVSGSTTVNPVVSEAAEALNRAADSPIQIDTLGGSSGGILCLAEGRCDLAMSSRPISTRDRKRFPTVDFQTHTIGWDAVALVVSRDVWSAGVRSLTPQQVRQLYEGEITRWNVLGGPDRRVVFFDKEPGRGTWEVFANWLYGEAGLAPSVRLPNVGANEETRAKVASTPGSISQLSAAWADGSRIFTLAIDGPNGPILPSEDSIESKDYPLVRPLLLISNGPLTTDSERLIDYLMSPEGQLLVRRHGYLAIPTQGSSASR